MDQSQDNNNPVDPSVPQQPISQPDPAQQPAVPADVPAPTAPIVPEPSPTPPASQPTPEPEKTPVSSPEPTLTDVVEKVREENNVSKEDPQPVADQNPAPAQEVPGKITITE